MNKKMKMPTYLKEFECIADRCEDTCCAGFAIPMDKNTYEKYEKSDDVVIKEGFHGIRKNQHSTSMVDFAYIDATNSCPFLKNGLCGIQKSLGESYLSSSCSKYPKHISVVDNTGEKWATLSCPEVARLVLLNKDGLSFEEREEEIDMERDIVTFQIDTNVSTMTSYFRELRAFTIDVLQNRNMALDTRMSTLKFFFKEMNILVQNKKENEIPLLIEKFKHLNEVEFDEEDFNLNLFFDSLASFKENNTFVKRYEEVVFETFQGFINGTGDAGVLFLEQNSFILENYLVHYVFQKLFPFSYGNNVFEAFKMLELHYDLLRIHIIGVGSYKKEMNKEEAVRVVQSFVKEAEHSTIFLPFFFEILT